MANIAFLEPEVLPREVIPTDWTYGDEARDLSTLEAQLLLETIEPILDKLAQNPRVAAQAINHIILSTLENGLDIAPELSTLLEAGLATVKVTPEIVQQLLSALETEKPALIELARGLDPEVLTYIATLFVYLRINKDITIDEFFTIAKKLRLSKLPPEFWNILNFGTSSTGKFGDKQVVLPEQNLTLEPQEA